jgi:epoxyqueuosine reductase
MSISGEKLARLFAAEGLELPAVLHWPISGPSEDDRVVREEHSRRGRGAHPPPGLEWMSSHAEVKYRPDLVLKGCRSVLVSALSYYRDDPIIPKNSGRIARYARGRDYHKELGNRLRRIARLLESEYPDEKFKSFVDIGPLDESWLVKASGAGFIGRHALAILPGVGSWVVLGHILCTAPVDVPPPRPSPLTCPEGCRRCLDACPTDALSLPGILDASRCISYLTIEAPSDTPEEYRKATADRVFGCDACQEACPFNARVLPTDVEAFRTDIAGAEWDIGDLLLLESHEDVVDRFAGSPLMRAGRSGLVRNACTAAGNSKDPQYRGRLEILCDDDDSGIAEHARWALGELGDTAAKE